MGRPVIYLDYNATAPLKEPVIDEMSRALSIYGNPSSVHAVGRRAKSMLEHARSTVAASLNARNTQVTFTSGGTEANNTALYQDCFSYIIFLSKRIFCAFILIIYNTAHIVH